MATGSGTGTQAAAAYSATAGALLALIREALADAAETTWSDEQLLGFLGEAIREYSQHLPRAGLAVLATAQGQRLYSLPWDATAVLSVAYSTADAFSSFIRRRGRRSARFDGGRCYDLLLSHDLTDAPALLLGFDPDSGATLEVRYMHPHPTAPAAEDALTVPDEHHHVLLQYVLFAAARQLQAREQAAPTNISSLLMAQLAANTRRLELAYLNALNRILSARLGEGERVAWGMEIGN